MMEMFRNFAHYIAFCSLFFVIFVGTKFKDFDTQVSTISPQDFYDSFKPISMDCSNNSNLIIEEGSFDRILMKAYKQKYITCTFHETGGIGYQLWRFASLYGIGKECGRMPYFEGQNLEQMINLKELGTIFPMLPEILQIKNPSNKLVKTINFGNDCCEFDASQRPKQFHEKYLRIRANYLQSYKYFQSYKNELRNILKCGITIQTSLKHVTKELFKNDTNFKLCAHIRRGNFLDKEMLESKEDFITPAVDYAFRHFAKERGIQNVSLLFITDDYEFVKNLSIQNNFINVFIPKPQSRGEDLCLGMNYCDAMIMTASGSAFGWWMSYMMKENSTVFCHSKIGDDGNSQKDIYDFDLFPPEWIRLSIIDGKAENEKKWWRERVG